MFIVSNKRFKVKRADGSPYIIERGFVGNIPEDVAKEWLIQAAIKDGSISTPDTKSDKNIEKAITTGQRKAKATQKAKESQKG